MQLFVRAVVTGFGMALGAAIYRKVARQLGLDEPDDKGKGDRSPEPIKPIDAKAGAEPAPV